MRLDLLTLRERHKHDIEKQKEVAREWADYASEILNIKSAREMLDVDMGSDAHDRFDERTTESYIAVREVHRRVIDALGEDSRITPVLAIDTAPLESGGQLGRAEALE